MLITILIVLAIIALLLFIFRGRFDALTRYALEGSTPEIGWRV